MQRYKKEWKTPCLVSFRKESALISPIGVILKSKKKKKEEKEKGKRK